MANSVSRYEPQANVTRLPELMDRLFRESFVVPSMLDGTWNQRRSALPVNLFETPDSYIMHLALPGLAPENLDIQVVGREATVKGKIELSTPEKGTWIWQGIPTGEFRETYTLPVEVDGDKAEATYNHGILTIGLPKAAHLRPKNISVQVKS